MTPAFAQAFFHSAGPKFLAFVAVPAVRALLVGCAAGLALAALRVKRPPARLQVWTAVLCAALAMPLLGIILPRTPFAIPARTIESVSREIPLPVWHSILERGKLAAKPAVEEAQMPSAQETGNSLLSSHAAGTGLFHSGAAARSKNHGEIVRFAGTRFAHNGGQRTYLPLLHKSSVANGFGANVKSASVPEEAWPGAPAAMPVMPAPVIDVVAQRGSTPAKMAGTLAGVALVIYGLIAFVLIARLFASVWFSRKLSRAARAIEPLYFGGANDEQNVQAREALRVLRLRSAIAGLKSAPALKESAALAVPATIGVAHPAILLPLNWRVWSSEQLDAILAHEISHVARRDALTQALSLVHRAIFWFSPLAWWLDRQLTELAEQASDEAALAGGADRTRYAETLLGFFAQLENAPGRIWWQGVSMAKKSHAGRAERRVDRILAWTGSRSTRKWFALAVVACAAPVIFLAASLHPVIAYGQDKTQSDGQNVIMPGGPKAPALPKAPKGGVTAPAIPAAPQGGVPAVPAMAPAPRSGVQGGVAAPAIAPIPGTPVAPSTPAPSRGVVGHGPTATAPSAPALMPVPGASARPPIVPGPIAGVVGYGPATPPPNPALAPTGPRTVRPSISTPNASTVPMAPVTSISAMVSDAPVAAVAGVGTPAPQANEDERAQSAELQKELADLRKQVAVDAEQVHQAKEQLAKAENSAQGSANDQVRSAEANLREAQAKVDRAQERLERIQERIEEIADGRAENRAEEMAQRAQEIARRDAQRKQEIDERAMEQAERAQRDAERVQDAAERDQQSMTVSGHSNVTINGRYSSGWGPRYVMLIGPKDVSMSGSDEDLQHAMRLHEKVGKDMIWFEHDEKSYIITDPAFIAKARALFAPEDALAKQQDELGRQQNALGQQQDALGEQMDKVTVKPPDVSDELRQIQARLKELQSTGATQSELGRIQSELGALQSRVGRVQSQAGVQQSGIGRQQAELGRKQATLGRQQAELGRQQAAISKEANRQLRSMFDDAMAKGIAKPE